VTDGPLGGLEPESVYAAIRRQDERRGRPELPASDAQITVEQVIADGDTNSLGGARSLGREGS